MGEGVRVRSPVADDGAVTDLDGLDRVHDLLAELQDAVREKDLSASLALFTEDAALLGTAAANLDRDTASAYLARVFDQPGHVSWDWDTIAVLDSRAGAITFVALGTVSLVGDPDHPASDPIRLTGLVVEDGDRWRLRLFHGSIPAG